MTSDLKLSRVPWDLLVASWIFGLGACFLLYHLLWGDLQHLSVWTGHWWQWILTMAFLSASAGMLYFAQIEVVTFSKEKHKLLLDRYLPLISHSAEQHSLQDVQDVFVVQKGQYTRFENTLRFHIVLQMRWGRKIKVLETKDFDKVKAKAKEIRKYLGFSTLLNIYK